MGIWYVYWYVSAIYIYLNSHILIFPVTPMFLCSKTPRREND